MRTTFQEIGSLMGLAPLVTMPAIDSAPASDPGGLGLAQSLAGSGAATLAAGLAGADAGNVARSLASACASSGRASARVTAAKSPSLNDMAFIPPVRTRSPPLLTSGAGQRST